jgi:hypothetical protein
MTPDSNIPVVIDIQSTPKLLFLDKYWLPTFPGPSPTNFTESIKYRDAIFKGIPREVCENMKERMLASLEPILKQYPDIIKYLDQVRKWHRREIKCETVDRKYHKLTRCDGGPYSDNAIQEEFDLYGTQNKKIGQHLISAIHEYDTDFGWEDQHISFTPYVDAHTNLEVVFDQYMGWLKEELSAYENNL